MRIFERYCLCTVFVLSLLLFLSYCQVCTQSQYFNGQRCAPCKPNCKCSADNTCDTCLPGYAFDARFQNCLQCPIAIDLVNIGCRQCCSQISGTAFVCSQCLNQKYVFMKGGQCLKASGCLSLSNNGVCSSCDNGFYLMEGKCISCHASCETCKDSTFCSTCKEGYFNATNAHYSYCLPCSLGCQSCTSGISCQSCLTGYFLSGPTCTACSANCLSCSASGCSQCNSISTLIGNSCFLCTDTSKGGTAGCQSCLSCVSAAATFYVNNGKSIACTTTFPNSLYCQSSGPYQCQNDYDSTLINRFYLVQNKCIANLKSCKKMLNIAGQCSQCYFEGPDMYYKMVNNQCVKCNQVGCKTYNTNCQCQECQDGYRYVNNLCVACQNLHCTKCQNNVQSCQNCANYYGIFSSACVLCSKTHCLNCDGDYTQCKICQNGYYLNSGSCYLCQTNCLLCQSNTKCTLCANGYYLQTNGRCKQLPSNCLVMDSRYLSDNVGVCKKCQYGYKVIEGNCYPCSLSLYNMNTCEKYCPSYYALKKQSSHLYGVVFSVMAVLLLMFL